MGVYHCNRCNGFFDDDIHGCYEDPKDGCELLCEPCSMKCGDCDAELEEDGKCLECVPGMGGGA